MLHIPLLWWHYHRIQIEFIISIPACSLNWFAIQTAANVQVGPEVLMFRMPNSVSTVDFEEHITPHDRHNSPLNARAIATMYVRPLQASSPSSTLRKPKDCLRSYPPRHPPPRPPPPQTHHQEQPPQPAESRLRRPWQHLAPPGCTTGPAGHSREQATELPRLPVSIQVVGKASQPLTKRDGWVGIRNTSSTPATKTA